MPTSGSARAATRRSAGGDRLLRRLLRTRHGQLLHHQPGRPARPRPDPRHRADQVVQPDQQHRERAVLRARRPDVLAARPVAWRPARCSAAGSAAIPRCASARASSGRLLVILSLGADRTAAVGLFRGLSRKQQRAVAVAVEAIVVRSIAWRRPPSSTSSPISAETSMNRVDRGRWKLVSSPSTALKR